MIGRNMGRNKYGNTEGTGHENAGSKAKANRPGLAAILKYCMLVIIIAYIVLLMLFASGSTKPYEQIEKAVENALDTSNLKKADIQGLKRYYGLNSADYDGVMLYTSQASMSAEEVLLIKAKDDSQVKRVKKAIEKRLENRKNDFDGYAPEQAKMIDQAQMSVRGKYIFLAVAPKAERYKEAFAKSL